jgi:hypothetical protein
MNEWAAQAGTARPAAGPRTVTAVSAIATFAAIASALVMLGSLMPWARLVKPGSSDGVLNSTIDGLVILDGRVALACGLVIAGAAAGLVMARSGGAQRAALVAILVASVAVGTIAVVDAIRARERFPSVRVDQVARQISDTTGLPFDPIRARLASQVGEPVSVTLGAGMALVLAGTALGATASIMALDRLRR